MVLFIARLILVAIGATYTFLGACMAISGLVEEYARQTHLPILVFVGNPPPAMFEDPDFDEACNRDFIPFIVAGIMLAAVGISFLCNIP